MVTPAKLLADIALRKICHTADEIHSDLSCVDYIAASALPPQYFRIQIEVFADIFRDSLRRGNVLIAFDQHIADGAAYGLFIHLVTEKIAVGEDLVERTLDLADICRNIFSDIAGDVIRQPYAQKTGLHLDDGKARFKIGGRNIHHQTGFKSSLQAVFQQRHFAGRTVGGENDLLFRLVQRVEGMEKLLLCLLLAGNKLDIVHQQHICLTVLLAEFVILTLADRVHQINGKFIAAEIDDFCFAVVLSYLSCNGIQKVGFTQTAVTVNKQGVILLCGIFSNCFCRRVSQFVGRTYNVGLKGEGIRLVQLAGRFRCDAVVGGQLIVVEDLDLQIHGENILQHFLDVLDEQTLDIVLFKIVAAVQHKSGVFHRNDFHFIKPSVYCGVTQLSAQPFQYDLPYISN